MGNSIDDHFGNEGHSTFRRIAYRYGLPFLYFGEVISGAVLGQIFPKHNCAIMTIVMASLPPMMFGDLICYKIREHRDAKILRTAIAEQVYLFEQRERTHGRPILPNYCTDKKRI